MNTIRFRGQSMTVREFLAAIATLAPSRAWAEQDRRDALRLASTTFTRYNAPAHPPGFKPIGGRP